LQDRFLKNPQKSSRIFFKETAKKLQLSPDKGLYKLTAEKKLEESDLQKINSETKDLLDNTQGGLYDLLSKDVLTSEGIIACDEKSLAILDDKTHTIYRLLQDENLQKIAVEGGALEKYNDYLKFKNILVEDVKVLVNTYLHIDLGKNYDFYSLDDYPPEKAKNVLINFLTFLNNKKIYHPFNVAVDMLFQALTNESGLIRESAAEILANLNLDEISEQNWNNLLRGTKFELASLKGEDAELEDRCHLAKIISHLNRDKMSEKMRQSIIKTILVLFLNEKFSLSAELLNIIPAIDNLLLGLTTKDAKKLPSKVSTQKMAKKESKFVYAVFHNLCDQTRKVLASNVDIQFDIILFRSFLVLQKLKPFLTEKHQNEIKGLTQQYKLIQAATLFAHSGVEEKQKNTIESSPDISVLPSF
jgi:hypothetical protein